LPPIAIEPVVLLVVRPFVEAGRIVFPHLFVQTVTAVRERRVPVSMTSAPCSVTTAFSPGRP
jgi:hypothetical protein